MLQQRKAGPSRVRLQFAGWGPTITFQRGTTADFALAIWEIRQATPTDTTQYADASAMRNANARMPAMQPLDGRAQKCQRCALDTRKSRKTCTRATDFSSSG